MNIAYYQGAFLKEREVMIPVSDRGFLFGDGAYATVQVREGIPLFLKKHLALLKRNCTEIHLSFPPIAESSIDRLIQENGADTGIWRLKIMVTGGDALELRLPLREGRVLMTLQPFPPPQIRPLKLGIFPTPIHLCHAHYKSLAHFNRLYVMEEAFQQGVDDCVTLSENQELLEAAFGNLFWIEDQTIYTPHPDLPLYFGVTVQNMLTIAENLGYKVEYVKMKLDQLPSKGVCFRTSTMQGIWPVSQIGRYRFLLNKNLERIFLESYEKRIFAEKKEAVLSSTA